MLDPQSSVRVAGVCRIEEADLAAAYDRIPVLRSQQTLTSAAAFGVLSAVVPVYGLWSSEDGSLDPSYLLSSVAFAAIAGWLVHAHQSRAKRAWAALEEWQRQLRFEFSDSGLRVKTERNSSEAEWSMHQSWLEAPDAFYVQQRTGAFLIIPKRAFDGEPEVAHVRELLGANVRPPTDAPKRPARTMQKTLFLWLLLIALLGLIYQIMRS